MASSKPALLIALSAAAAAYVGAVVAGFAVIPQQLVLENIYLALLAVFLIAAGGMAVNKISGTGRGKIIALSIILLFVGNFIAFYFISLEVLYVMIAATVLLVAHSTALKKVPLVGNIVVAILVSIAVFLGAFVQGSYMAAWPLALLAFLSVTAKEIYRAIDKALGEKMHSYSTIATKIGVIKARLLGSAFIVAAIVASFVPFFLNLSALVYLFFAIIADILFAAAAVSPLRFSSTLIKIGIVVVFVAFFADAFIAAHTIFAV